MSEIEEKWVRIEKDEFNTNFFDFFSNERILFLLRTSCECGKYNINGAYVYVIENLKKAGLLNKDFRLKCCVCYVRDKDREI